MKAIGKFLLSVFRLPILAGVLVAFVGAGLIIVAASLANNEFEQI